MSGRGQYSVREGRGAPGFRLCCHVWVRDWEEGRGKAAEAFFDEVLRRGAVDLSRGIFGMLQRCSRRARLRVVSTTRVPQTHSSPARSINIMFKQEISLMPFAPAQKYRNMYDGLY